VLLECKIAQGRAKKKKLSICEKIRLTRKGHIVHLEREIAQGRAKKKNCLFVKRYVLQNKVIFCIYNAKLCTVGPNQKKVVNL